MSVATDLLVDGLDLDEIDEDLAQFQEDEYIKEALSKNVDLRQYAAQIEGQLHDAEYQNLQDTAACVAELTDIYNEYNSCDQVLVKMQEMLLGFQADLGGISDEIRHLQSTSQHMQTQLANRTQVSSSLRLYLDKAIVPSELITSISDASVNDDYITYLVQLNDKLHFANMTSSSPSAAMKDVAPELHKLKIVATHRVRDFLRTTIASLASPNTNVKMLQETSLLKFKYLYQFLSENSLQAATDVKKHYVDTMSRIFHSLYKSYYTGLLKLQVEVCRKSDLIGNVINESSSSSLGSLSIPSSIFSISKKSTSTTTYSPLALGTRGDSDVISSSNNNAPIQLHVATVEKKKYPFELIFKSVQSHMMDAATHEYFFLLDFFQDSDVSNTFIQIFAKSISSCLEFLENYLFTCYDAIGMLLMIRITSIQRDVMSNTRRVMVLDSYFDRVTCLLWPRFKIVFDLHLKSIRTFEKSFTNSTSNSSSTIHPHIISRRYADFAASIITLYHSNTSTNSTAEEMVLNHLALLRQAVVSCLVTISRTSNSRLVDQTVFLINNYDSIISIFTRNVIESSEGIRKFEELLTTQKDLYVEEELLLSFKSIIVKSGGEEQEKVLKEFQLNWKEGIRRINESIMRNFSNFTNGMTILTQTLTQLLLYYTRFTDNYDSENNNDVIVVPTSEILEEIKKYCQSFE